MTSQYSHLPMTKQEMDSRGWHRLDVLLITGDAYFDHPSVGVSVIGRVLEKEGYRVGIVARPAWQGSDDFVRLGRPTLFAGVTAGAVDSNLNNFTAHKMRRREDVYAPEGDAAGRPNFATLVYANRLKELFPSLPIVLGGVEASTRRFAYYDYMKDKVRRSILVDSRADLLVYGHGETQVTEIARRIGKGKDLSGIPGTAYLCRKELKRSDDEIIELPQFKSIENDAAGLIEQTKIMELAARPGFRGVLSQKYQDLDSVFRLPFSRTSHPSYKQPIKALETVRWSVISHRGCPGGCSFCALAIHQGRGVVRRSPESILQEIESFKQDKSFKGVVSDVGGPTANAYDAIPLDLSKCGPCQRLSCLFPKICSNLNTDHTALMKLLTSATDLPSVKKVFLASGIRHDLALKHPVFIDQVAAHHTGGHLKVAPEHVHRDVLKTMRKPDIGLFLDFETRFIEASKKAGLKQYLVPYFIAGFPGCRMTEAVAVEEWLRKRNQQLRQVQTFVPLPGTMAAAYWASGQDQKGNKMYIPKLSEQKRQKAMLNAPENRSKNAKKNKKRQRP